MPTDRTRLDEITALTLAHYDQRALPFWQATRDHDVSQNMGALLRHLQGGPVFDILDLGCGPGRDLKTFADLGHRAVGLDGAPHFAQMAHEYSGCEVWRQNLLALQLPAARFDGVFANAVLFHVPTEALDQVLDALFDTLRPGGVLFCSNPHGQGQEGWQAGRYGAFHTLAAWRNHLQAAGFAELEHYYRPQGLPREQQPWLATVWRRP